MKVILRFDPNEDDTRSLDGMLAKTIGSSGKGMVEKA
jgi:hypothetical protein